MTQPLNFADEAHAANAYVDPTDPEARALMGTTSVIKKALPPYLVPWAAKLTAEYAYDQRDAWANLERAAAVDLLKKAPDRSRDAAGDKGTVVHRFMALAAAGERPDDVFDSASAGYISAGLRFLDEWQPRFMWVEATVFHPELGYAGTLDFIAELPGLGLVIGDYKTSKGVYPEVGVQLASYRFASHAVAPDHTRLAIPGVDGGVVVHLKGDGTYDLRPVRATEVEFDAFRHCLAICDWKARNRGTIGHKLPVPETSPGEGPVAVASPAPSVEPHRGSAPSPGERSAWLLERVKTIIRSKPSAGMATAGLYTYSDPGAYLTALWPDGVPTFAQARDAGHTHTDAELDAIAEACSLTEQAFGLAFPDGVDPKVAAAEAKVSGDDPRVVELVERIRALPSDLLAAVEAEAPSAGVTAKVTSGRLTETQLDALVGLVSAAEVEHNERRATAASLIGDLDEDGQRCALSIVEPTSSAWKRLTGRQVGLLELIVEAIACGYVETSADGLAVTEACDSLLVEVHGNRRDALNHAKRVAKAHDVEAPTKFADVLGDPLLVALCIAQEPETADATAAA